jgi:hypothetical protein
MSGCECKPDRAQPVNEGVYFMKRLFLGLALLALTATLAHASSNSVNGVVTRMESGMICVVTDSGDTRLVAVDPDTQYMKWIMEKSWAQDPHVDAAYMRIGDRVRIKLRTDEPEATARKVYVVESPSHPQG